MRPLFTSTKIAIKYTSFKFRYKYLLNFYSSPKFEGKNINHPVSIGLERDFAISIYLTSVVRHERKSALLINGIDCVSRAPRGVETRRAA